MNTAPDTALGARVKNTMIRVLDLPVGRGQLADSEPLYSSTVRMDSMTLLQLLVTLEQEFAIEIDDEDVMNCDLRTVGNLVQLIDGLVGPTDQQQLGGAE